MGLYTKVHQGSHDIKAYINTFESVIIWWWESKLHSGEQMPKILMWKKPPTN